MSSKNVGLSRRNFLKTSAAAVGTISVGLKILGSELAFAQAAAPVDENSPTAMALGYKHDGSKVDAAKFPKKAAAGAEKQKCENCMFFSQGGQALAGHEGTWGKCTIFPTGLVAANGWCNTWALKPGVTL